VLLSFHDKGLVNFHVFNYLFLFHFLTASSEKNRSRKQQGLRLAKRECDLPFLLPALPPRATHRGGGTRAWRLSAISLEMHFLLRLSPQTQTLCLVWLRSPCAQGLGSDKCDTAHLMVEASSFHHTLGRNCTKQGPGDFRRFLWKCTFFFATNTNFVRSFQ